jgi:DNA-binding NarL/FixJ family response regulator
MNRIILADNQAIFRAGAARTLVLEEDMRLVAQCDNPARLTSALESFTQCILLVSTTLAMDPQEIAIRARAAGHRMIVIAENGAQLPDDLLRVVDGVLFRSVAGADLIDSVRRVAAGQRSVQPLNVTPIDAQDLVGARVRDRLTRKELEIVALIVQGYKNKAIAAQLGTKEQVIKNYLRSVYDKTGVSDRLELALFTIHHRTLSEAAARAADIIQARSA